MVKKLSYLGATVALVFVASLPATAQQPKDISISDSDIDNVDVQQKDISVSNSDIDNAELAARSVPIPPSFNNAIAQQQASSTLPVIPVDSELNQNQQVQPSIVSEPEVANLSTETSLSSTENAELANPSVPSSPQINNWVAQQAQQRPPQIVPVTPIDSPQNPNRRTQQTLGGEPDVLLDVPNLSVDEITLKVENLRAHVSLDARLANLLQLTAGADVNIDKVDLTIKGVKAQVLLKVRLENVANIIDRTLTTIDRNPQILERLLKTVDTTVGTVGNVANTALQPGGVVSQTVGTVGQTLNNVTQPGGLLTQTVNTLGQTVQRTIDTTGNIVESTVNNSGGLLNQRTVGNLLNLRVLNEARNATGQIVRRVQDNSGAIIEYTLDSAGKIINPRIIRQAPGR